MSKISVAVLVCTCKRPKMLMRCLDSLAKQVINKDDLDLSIVVIDNNEDGSAKQIASDFREVSPFPVHYRHAPERGIAKARNVALAYVLEEGLNYFIFFDDDAIAAPDNVAKLMAPEYLHIHILHGHTIYNYNEKLPPESEEGRALKVCGTNNTRYNVACAKTKTRFNEQLGLAGGEDKEFALDLYNQGFKVAKTIKAIAHETWPLSRLTKQQVIYRQYQDGVSEFRCFRLKGGHPLHLAAKVVVAPLEIAYGLMLASGAWVLRHEGGKDEGMRKAARSAGRLAGLVGIKPQAYAVIHGE